MTTTESHVTQNHVTQNHVTQPPTFHKTWWRAPLVASSLGLPLLAMEYGVVRAHDGMDQYGAVIYWALALFAVAWVLPHRRSMRTLRMVAASLALGCVLLPVLFALLLGVALA
ncbi:hypothetical protein [Streptomyces sp. MZ04]|uniref:hypothetical protein n=1 Tax=Streptomyces sp. MZ04 TaxID=2559236 RepID=UPI00107E7891|nr:hypothetical protein [Streptomyces sp. MZ04]TGB13424.1 hypothetical protein E2651_09340 [Streptomyces sp. MZ04]